MLAIDRNATPTQPALAWMWRSTSLRIAALFLLGYVAVAVLIAPDAFAASLSHYAGTLLNHVPLILLPLLALAVIPLLRGESRDGLLEHLRVRVALVSVLIGALLLAFTAFTTIKFSIPAIVPFHADSWAADLDAFIHGVDPWVVAHAIWPESWSGLMFAAYSHIWFAYWVATPIFVVLWAPPQLVKRYLWSMLMVFAVCGSVLALFYSSVGPIFYREIWGDGRFDALTGRLAELDGMRGTLAYAGYLLESYQSNEAVFGTGISAIPSMHVAVVTLNALLFGTLSRWAGALAWAFAALILFGSVYTGWHYAIDGYMSIFAVATIWFAVRRAHLEGLFMPSVWTAGSQPRSASALRRQEGQATGP
ncbi:MAG: phosphatase PAP2 family protein [Henriciella sp.]|uniref:phosphatase PAP2 family protein n=1 Tax=Henriciella sp. TaxID=1968823 RepID=UPI003C755E59